MAVERYRVLNPRNIPPGIPILTIGTVNFYAGDEVAPTGPFSAEQLQSLLDDGFLELLGEEVTDG